MRNLSDAALGQASVAFSVANTPLFLLRKLRDDAEVRDIARNFSGEEILEQFAALLSRGPQSLRDEVAPYVFAVALSLKDTDAYLRTAAESEHLDKRNWLGYILRVLIETYSPTSTQEIFVPGQLNDVRATAQGITLTGESRMTIVLDHRHQ